MNERKELGLLKWVWVFVLWGQDIKRRKFQCPYRAVTEETQRCVCISRFWWIYDVCVCHQKGNGRVYQHNLHPQWGSSKLRIDPLSYPQEFISGNSLTEVKIYLYPEWFTAAQSLMVEKRKQTRCPMQRKAFNWNCTMTKWNTEKPLNAIITKTW